jgi:4a-hydroxytetrahydrobiopterin dehydratase
MQRLSEEEIDGKLGDFGDWSRNGDKLQRTFSFDDFMGSVAFVIRVAELAETLEHHPDILIRYNKVTLTTTTHDAGGLTEKDFELARAMDGCVAAT